MKRYKKGDNREQLTIEPMCLDDMLPPDAEVRALEIIIEKMDIPALGFTYSETKQTGRKPYDPADMLKLYVYSYFNGIRSSRKIERECYRNIELMWLIDGLKPDFKTIADFRKNNKQPIKAAFQKFSMICSELGLIGKEIVAVDGSKFRASNSRLAYHTEKKINEKIKYHTECAEQYIKLLDASDKEEIANPKYSKEELLEKVDKINKRIEELGRLKEKVIENGAIYETDKDARMMRTNNNGADICHNVQIAVDDKNHLVVAVDVTSQPVDKEQLYNISSQAKENMQVNKITAVADKGYYSASQFEKCETDNIEVMAKEANQTHHVANADYEKDKFTFDENANCYICPAGQVLKPFRSGRIFANQKACKACVQKGCCTLGKYRTVHDRPSEKYARIVDKRTSENADIYKKRKQLAEHPFGTVKRGFGFSYFLTRGAESVRAESCLHFLVYNMKRVINIMGIVDLRAALLG